MGKHKPKDMKEAPTNPDPPWVGPGVAGRWYRQERSIQQMVYITMTGSLESLPSSAAAPAQRGPIRGKGERQDDDRACRAGSSRLEVLK